MRAAIGVGGSLRRSRWLVVLGFALLAACSASEVPDAWPTQATVDRAGIDGGPFEPIDGMEVAPDLTPIDGEDEVAILKAEMRLFDRCMEAKGFDGTDPAGLPMRVRPPAFLSPDELRRSGYRYDWELAAEVFLLANGPSGLPDPTEGLPWPKVKAWSYASSGRPDQRVEVEDVEGGTVAVSAGGCIGTTRKELYGSVENAIRFDRAQKAISAEGLTERLRTRTEYATAMKTWQGCMRDAGHEVDEREDYGFPFVERKQWMRLGGGGRRLSQPELDEIAHADAGCQEVSGLHRVREQLLPWAKDAVADELGFEMSQYLAFQHAVLERAKRIR